MMIKEEFQAVKTATHESPTLSQDKWRKLVARHCTEIEFHTHDSVTQTPSMPTPVMYMRLRRLRGFLGLTARNLLTVDLAAGSDEIEKEVFLHTLGLALQGERYLSQQPKKMRYARQLRGPKADPSSMRTLLKADIFAALVQYGAGDKNAVRRAARKRAEALLTARTGADPALFAMPMACDTIDVVLPSLASPVQTVDRFFFRETLARAEEIARCIDSSLLNDWYGFGHAAQDMAWRGASKRQILGAAHMADAPHIRTIAMMISDLTGLVGHTPGEFTSIYSAFCDSEVNHKAHELAMEQEFEWALAQDPLVHGSRVFLQAADRQIANLQKGQVTGWCADALHISAKVFDDHGGGQESLIAARQAFDENKNGNNWDSLNRLGEMIVDRCRNGVLTGLRELRDLAMGQAGLHGMREALESQMILVDAPASTHALERSFKGFAARGAAPSEPVLAPSMPRFLSVPVPAGPGGGTHMQNVPLHENQPEAAEQ